VKLHVGTSGYNFAEWKGSFYPEKLPAAQMLPYYAERLATVEINYTFYRMPSAKTIAGWDAATPAGFTFGPVLFQLPPNFKKDLPRLGDLLTQFPPDLRCAWEFRHESWFSDDVYDALRKGNAALCVADTENGTTPLVTTASWGYLRLRDEGYAADDLERWVGTVRQLGNAWQDAYVFFKHEESGIGPKLAQQFERLLGQ